MAARLARRLLEKHVISTYNSVSIRGISCSAGSHAISNTVQSQQTPPGSRMEQHLAITLHEPYLPSEGSAMMSLDGTSLPVPDIDVSPSSGTAEVGHKAADRIDLTKMAEVFESRARAGGLIVEGTAAVGAGGSGSLYTGVGTAAMAGMVDAVAGAFVGEKERVAKAVSGMTTGTPPAMAHIQTLTQAWPRKSLQPDNAKPETDPSVLEYCMKNRARGL